MKTFAALLLLLAGALAATAAPTVIVAVGAAGEPVYGEDFARQAVQWREAALKAGAKFVLIGAPESGGVVQTPPNATDPADRDALAGALAAEPVDGDEALWLVLVGHGTFDSKEAKFNLRGLDVTATELATCMKPFRRPTAVINTTSASAPFMAKLAAPGRVVITATRSGNEQNYARFGRYFADTLLDPAADLDQDGQVSLLESFLGAAQRVAEFYKSEGRLATEHALIDDTGDGLGTPADWFRGVRATKKSKDNAPLDGVRAHQFHLVQSAAEQQITAAQRVRRDELEQRIAALRERKATLPEADYYRQLEAILVELGGIYFPAAAPGGS